MDTAVWCRARLGVPECGGHEGRADAGSGGKDVGGEGYFQGGYQDVARRPGMGAVDGLHLDHFGLFFRRHAARQTLRYCVLRTGGPTRSA